MHRPLLTSASASMLSAASSIGALNASVAVSASELNLQRSSTPLLDQRRVAMQPRSEVDTPQVVESYEVPWPPAVASEATTSASLLARQSTLPTRSTGRSPRKDRALRLDSSSLDRSPRPKLAPGALPRRGVEYLRQRVASPSRQNPSPPESSSKDTSPELQGSSRIANTFDAFDTGDQKNFVGQAEAQNESSWQEARVEERPLVSGQAGAEPNLEYLKAEIQWPLTERCPAPPIAAGAVVIGADAMGWGENRVLVLLVAECAKTKVLTYSAISGKWHEPKVDANVESDRPSAVTEAAMCAFRVLDDPSLDLAPIRRLSTLVLYGGRDASGKLCGDLHCLIAQESVLTADITWRWARVDQTRNEGFKPEARASHAMCACGEKIYIHGGILEDDTAASDFWVLDIDYGADGTPDAIWQRLQDGQGHVMLGLQWAILGTSRPSTGVEIINAALSVALQQKLDFTRTEFQRFNVCNLRPDSFVEAGDSPSTFYKPVLVPQARQRHSLCCVGNRLFLFGGNSDRSSVVNKDFLAYDVVKQEWAEVMNVRAGCNRQGSLRADHTVCACGPILVIVGGNIHGHLEHKERRKLHGLLLFDSRDGQPVYSAPLPKGTDPADYEVGSHLVALSSRTFIMISLTGTCHAARITLEGWPMIRSCELVSGCCTLDLTTRGVHPETHELLVRMQSPVVTITALATRRPFGLGLRWRQTEIRPDTGAELRNHALSTALVERLEFSSDEFHSFGVLETLRSDHFIQASNGMYCLPAGRDGQESSLNAAAKNLVLDSTGWHRVGIDYQPTSIDDEWIVKLPERRTLVERASFAEGLLSVEVCGSTDQMGQPIFTDDGYELEVRASAMSGTWQGLIIESGGRLQNTKAGTPIKVIFSEVVMTQGKALKAKPDELFSIVSCTPVAVRRDGQGFFARKVYPSEDLKWTIERDPDAPSGATRVCGDELSLNDEGRFQLDAELFRAGPHRLFIERGNGCPMEIFQLSQLGTIDSIKFDVVSAAVGPGGRVARVTCASTVQNGSLLRVLVELASKDAYGNHVKIDPADSTLVAVSRRTGSIVARQWLDPDGPQVQELTVCIIEPVHTLYDWTRSDLGAEENWLHSKWAHICKEQGVDDTCTASLLELFVTGLNEDQELVVIGRLTSPPCVQVLGWPTTQQLRSEDVTPEMLGLTSERMAEMEDGGARATRLLQKMVDEIRAGKIHCVLEEGSAMPEVRGEPLSYHNDDVEEGSEDSDDDAHSEGCMENTADYTGPRITRFFHVVNVHVLGGYENRLELMEYSRTLREPQQSHELRMNVIAQKFSFKSAGWHALQALTASQHQWRSRKKDSEPPWLHPGVQIQEARAAILRAGCVKQLNIQCNPTTYWTEHTISRSQVMPGLTSIFLVHHIEATVEPQMMNDFFVKQDRLFPAYEAFFIWQPRDFVARLMRARRKALLHLAEEFFRGPDLGEQPASSYLSIFVRMPKHTDGGFDKTGDEDTAMHGLEHYLAENPNVMATHGAGSLFKRIMGLRHIIEQLFVSSRTVTLSPLSKREGVMHFTATYAGTKFSGVKPKKACPSGQAILMVGSAEVITARRHGYDNLMSELDDGDAADIRGQISGPGVTVCGDVEGVWAGASAPIQGIFQTLQDDFAENSEFAQMALSLSATPLSVTYSSMMSGDPRKTVQHASMAMASLSSLRKELEAKYPECLFDNVAQLSDLVVKSYRTYDQVFQATNKTYPENLAKVLALADEEGWEKFADQYPVVIRPGGETRELCQPSLGGDHEWRNPDGRFNEEVSTMRYDRLRTQAAQAQLAVKNKLLRLQKSEEEMLLMWPLKLRMAGLAMEPWGSSEAMDPGLKGEPRLQEKTRVKCVASQRL